MQGVCWFLSQTGEEGREYALIQPWSAPSAAAPATVTGELSTTGPMAGKVKSCKASLP